MEIRNKLEGVFTIYLSGPMSGYENFNRPAFDSAADTLRARGFDVIVPGEGEHYEPDEVAARRVGRIKLQSYLSRDIDFIQERADAVVVLDGWEDSFGAKLEILVAQTLGIPVLTYPEMNILRDTIYTGVERYDV